MLSSVIGTISTVPHDRFEKWREPLGGASLFQTAETDMDNLERGGGHAQGVRGDHLSGPPSTIDDDDGADRSIVTVSRALPVTRSCMPVIVDP